MPNITVDTNTWTRAEPQKTQSQPKTGFWSRACKEVVWDATVGTKAFGLGQNASNLGKKAQEVAKTTEVAANVAKNASPTIGQAASGMGSFAELFGKVARTFFIFKIPKTIFDFVKSSIELSKHKQPGRKFETTQGALSIVENTGNLVAHAGDAGGALIAFNLISSSSVIWAAPLSFVGCVLNSIGIVACGLQYHETKNFYKQMSEVAQKAGKKQPYTVNDLEKLATLIREQDKARSERFTARQFSVVPADFMPKLERITEAVKNAPPEKQAEAQKVADKVVKELKHRVKVRLTGRILAIVAGVMGVVASIFITISLFMPPPVSAILAIIGLSIAVVSVALTFSRLIYERVEQRRLNKVMKEGMEWAD